MEQQAIEVRLADILFVYGLHGVCPVLSLARHDNLVYRFCFPFTVAVDRVPRIVIFYDNPLVLGLFDRLLILKGSDPSFPADEVTEVGFVCEDFGDRCEVPVVRVLRV